MLGCPPLPVLTQKPHLRQQAFPPRGSVGSPMPTILVPLGQGSGPSEAASSSPSLPTSNGSINVDHQVVLQVPFSKFNAFYNAAVDKIQTKLHSKEQVCSSESKGEGAQPHHSSPGCGGIHSGLAGQQVANSWPRGPGLAPGGVCVKVTAHQQGRAHDQGVRGV